MQLSLTQNEILQDTVDLEGVESLLTYLSLGFSFNTSFSTIKGRPRAAIPKSDADALKVHFSRIISGKSKPYLRARIPLILIGLIGFGINREQGTNLNSRIQEFKSLLTHFDDASMTETDLGILINTATQGLKRRYYTSKLNPKLDSVSSFFAEKLLAAIQTPSMNS